AGALLLDHVGLEDEGLELVTGDDVVEVADLPDEGIRLRVACARLLEVRPHAAPERRRLADVDDLVLRILVEVHARPVGNLVELLLECHRATLTFNAGRTPASTRRSQAAAARSSGASVPRAGARAPWDDRGAADGGTPGPCRGQRARSPPTRRR